VTGGRGSLRLREGRLREGVSDLYGVSGMRFGETVQAVRMSPTTAATTSRSSRHPGSVLVDL